MAFPSFPSDGATAVVNNISYVYRAASNSWIRVYTNSSTVSSLVVGGTGTSVSTSTGALIVRGGAGISGTLYADLIYSNGTLVGSGSVFAGGLITGATTINDTTLAVSTVTGALIVNGGVGIGGALYVNTTSFVAGAQIITTATIGQYAGGIATTGTTSTFVVLNNTNSLNTTSGALQVKGGVGIGGDVVVSGQITGGGTRNTSSPTPPANPGIGDIWYNTSTDVMYRWTSDGTSYYWIDEYSAVSITAQSTNKMIVFSLFFGG
jgi:hypothetical protein